MYDFFLVLRGIVLMVLLLLQVIVLYHMLLHDLYLELLEAKFVDEMWSKEAAEQSTGEGCHHCYMPAP